MKYQDDINARIKRNQDELEKLQADKVRSEANIKQEYRRFGLSYETNSSSIWSRLPAIYTKEINKLKEVLEQATHEQLLKEHQAIKTGFSRAKSAMKAWK